MSRKADKAPARFVTMENMKSRGQHFLANPLIIQVREKSLWESWLVCSQPFTATSPFPPSLSELLTSAKQNFARSRQASCSLQQKLK